MSALKIERKISGYRIQKPDDATSPVAALKVPWWLFRSTKIFSPVLYACSITALFVDRDVLSVICMIAASSAVLMFAIIQLQTWLVNRELRRRKENRDD